MQIAVVQTMGVNRNCKAAGPQKAAKQPGAPKTHASRLADASDH